MMNVSRLLLLLTLVAAVAGCASGPDANQMNRLASSLTKLSAAVDAVLRYDDIPQDAVDSVIFGKVSAANPTLLDDFKGFEVKLIRSEDDSAVLVCDASATTALLEDAGCTAKLDVHRWETVPPPRCEPSLNLKQVCKQQ